MRMVDLDGCGMTSSALGFGCSAVMGRVGRGASLAAMGAALDAGVTFFDTARSYGYGEAEAVLGEFLLARRDAVVVSTKFGILPAKSSTIKRALKPVARGLLRLAPGARKVMQGPIAAQFSSGHFTVEAMRSSLEASLRALKTGYVDLFFLHLPPVSVLQQDDLFAALEQLTAEGKVLRFGVAAEASVAMAALGAGLRTVQFPCNLFDAGLAGKLGGFGSDVVAIANHPFGGPQRIVESKRLIYELAQEPETPEPLRFKLWKLNDVVLADLVLNMITSGTGIKVVVPSMLRLEHLQANVAAMEHSRFAAEELAWLRDRLGLLPRYYRGRPA